MAQTYTIRFKKNLARFGNDTVVQCKKCGRTQYLKFKNGLKYGWSKCCGYTMPIVYCIANIEDAVKSLPLSVDGVKGTLEMWVKTKP